MGDNDDAQRLLDAMGTPEYQAAAAQLTPAERQHYTDTINSLSSTSDAADYAEGLAEWQQNNPDTPLTAVDGYYQPVSQSQHPSEQDNSGYYAAGGGALPHSPDRHLLPLSPAQTAHSAGAAASAPRAAGSTD